MIGPDKEERIELSVVLVVYWVTSEKLLNLMHQKHFRIAIEIGDRAGEGGAYENLGTAYQSLGDH